MQKEISSVRASRTYADIVAPIVNEAVSILGTQNVTIEEFLPRVSFEIIGAVLFNQRMGSLEPSPTASGKKFCKATNDAMEYGEALVLHPYRTVSRFLYWKPFLKAMDTIYEEGNRYIANVEKGLLLDTESEGYKKAAASYVGRNLLSKTLTVEQLRSNIITFLFAGVDSTSVTIRWMMINLAKNPDVQEKVSQEFASKLQGRTMLSDDLETIEFPYYRAMMKENFRVTPTIHAVARWLDEDFEFNGYNVPKGTMIRYIPQPILNDKDRVTNPDKFEPERWLDENTKQRDEGVGSIFAHSQFGFGPRSCLGQKLANVEIITFFSRLLQDYRFELDPPSQKFEATMHLTTIPEPMPKMKFTPRK